MDTPQTRCLILGCGNTLRGDDGIGPLLCAWAEERFASEAGVRVMASQQWTPDMAEDVAAAETVLFVDCSLEQAPGQIVVREMEPTALKAGLVTHHLGAAELLGVAEELYGTRPRRSLLLTVGGGCVEVSEGLSPEVRAAVSDAQDLIESTVRQLLR